MLMTKKIARELLRSEQITKDKVADKVEVRRLIRKLMRGCSK